MPTKENLNSYSTFLVLIISILLTFNNCSEDNNPSQSSVTPEAEAIITNIVEPQEERYLLFEELTVSMDTSVAKDSVLKLFLQDTLVQWAEVSTQGISVQYKNGMVGGLFIDPLNQPDSTEFDLILLEKESNKILKTNNVVPKSKKTIYLSPSNRDWEKYTQSQFNNYKICLPRVGFQIPEIYYNEEVTLKRFTELSEYGLIHISSHGMAWPTTENIQDVYLLTGESETVEVVEKYFEDIYEANVAFFSTSDGSQCFIKPEFITKNNNFSNIEPLIFGSFCFSSLGGWPQKMTLDAGASGYFGYDWSVRVNWDNWWNQFLIKALTDINVPTTTTAFGWMNNDQVKDYWDEESQKIVSIRYYGDSDLALRDQKYNRCSIEYRIQRNTHHEVTKSSGGADSWDTYGDNQRDDVVFEGNLKDNKFTGDYIFYSSADTVYYTVDVTLNSDTTKVESFSLTMHEDQTLITGGDTKRIYDTDKNIEGVNIDVFTFSSSDEHVFRVVGENTCNSVTTANYIIKEVVPSLGETWYSNSISNYCDDDSFIIIKFYTE